MSIRHVRAAIEKNNIPGNIGLYKENMENEEIVREAKKHKKEAVRLLKESQRVHKAAARGKVSESDAIDKVIELNKAAIDAAEKAIDLDKEYLDRNKGG